jgi:hypothetical protein
LPNWVVILGIFRHRFGMERSAQLQTGR